jgi:hypothetical protein
MRPRVGIDQKELATPPELGKRSLFACASSVSRVAAGNVKGAKSDATVKSLAVDVLAT